MSTDIAALRHRSVTEQDTSPAILQFFSQYGGLHSVPGLPGYWSPARDVALKNTVFLEPMWASAVYKSISKQAALGFQVDDSKDRQTRARRAQKLFLQADYVRGLAIGGWVNFITRHLADVILTDNGGFIEVIRATSAAGSRVLGIGWLSSHRCERTGDAERPVIYTDNRGYRHEMRAHQVVAYADMAGVFGAFQNPYFVGQCAASRAFDTISTLSAMRQYLREKVTGSRATAVHFLSGLSPKTMESAFKTSEEDSVRVGRQLFRGVSVIPVIGDTPLNLTTLALAEIPDGFDMESERKDAYMVYANALGVPVQDIQPLSGQGLGTGTQSLVLAEAADGQGLATWRKWYEQTMNEIVLPTSTTFTFSTNDLRDKKAKAEVSSVRSATRAAQIASGEITIEESRQMAADDGDIPREFLVEDDQTPGGTLNDTEKPVPGGMLAGQEETPVGSTQQDWRQLLGLKAAGDDATLATMLADNPELLKQALMVLYQRRTNTNGE